MKYNYRKLFALLALKEWTATTLARKTGIAHSTLSNAKKGKSSLSIDNLIKIKKALDVKTVDELFEVEEGSEEEIWPLAV